ncbi:228_t:CDS:2 [Paraglomus occultum]|uniref:228_t:CDS:1 n=1 Tax=Paraglomus occultum TaxID=144539 RepID=A0A9N9FYA9_9GLOM|nr:228_t:CDS:2 [Paraglomus occultum]
MTMISYCIILLLIVNIINYTNERFIFGASASVTNIIYVGDGGPYFTPSLTFTLPGNTVEWIWSQYTTVAGTYEVVQTTAHNDCTPLVGGFQSNSMTTGGQGNNRFSITISQQSGEIYYACNLNNHCANSSMQGVIRILVSPITTSSGPTSNSVSDSSGSGFGWDQLRKFLPILIPALLLVIICISLACRRHHKKNDATRTASAEYLAGDVRERDVNEHRRYGRSLRMSSL